MVSWLHSQQINLIISITDASASGVNYARELWENRRKPFTAEFIELDHSDVDSPSMPSNTNKCVKALARSLSSWQLVCVTIAWQDGFEAQVQEKGIQADMVCCMQHLHASWLSSKTVEYDMLVSFANLYI